MSKLDLLAVIRGLFPASQLRPLVHLDGRVELGGRMRLGMRTPFPERVEFLNV